MSDNIVAYALKIYGRVQGVGFRFFCSMLARNLRIHGWVKNCNDGTVETVCEGSADLVAQYIAECKKGCDFAVVEHVDIESCQVQGFSSFRVKY